MSMNLALSLASELDKSVLLIDGDVAKRDLSRWMGVEEERGLVDALVDRGSIEQEVIATNIERLCILPCGRYSENLDELFASDTVMASVVEAARSQPDRIMLIDGPPLLATTEAAVLARCAGQVILVVEANKTPQKDVMEAFNHVKNCQLVSSILNKTPIDLDDRYGYGYGYGQGVRSLRGDASQDQQTPQ